MAIHDSILHSEVMRLPVGKPRKCPMLRKALGKGFAECDDVVGIADHVSTPLCCASRQNSAMYSAIGISGSG